MIPSGTRTGAVLISVDDKQQSVHVYTHNYSRLLWHFEKKDVMAGKIDEEEAHIQAYLVYAILMSIVAVVTLLVVLVMRRRIALVSQLFKETGKAIYSMPGLLLQPIYVSRLLFQLKSLLFITTENYYSYIFIFRLT